MTLCLPDIRQAVAAYYGLSVEQLIGPDRHRAACDRRIVGYRLCVELTDRPHAEIGQAFGGRDHKTVQNALARKLTREQEVAQTSILAALQRDTAHSLENIRRWPFKSYRKPQSPFFIRRHTA